MVEFRFWIPVYIGFVSSLSAENTIVIAAVSFPIWWA